LKKTSRSKTIGSYFYIISVVLLIMCKFSNKEILGILGFVFLCLTTSYASLKKYKNTGNIPWLNILIDIILITTAICMLTSYF
jgi:hypothetical protein